MSTTTTTDRTDQLAASLRRVTDSLDDFVRYHEDPGTEALSALYEAKALIGGRTSAPVPDEPDPIVRALVLAIGDGLTEVEDPEDLPFGDLTRIDAAGNTLIARHETADGPAVRITVERIA